VVPARVARLAPDVLEAVLHHPSSTELGPAPRPAAREDVPEQVRDEQHAAAFDVAPQVVEGDPPELQRARVGCLERGLAFRGRLLLVLVGESHEDTLMMRYNYARALYMDAAAALDDLREAVTMLEDVNRTGRRVFGGAHPFTTLHEAALRQAREALRARETPTPSN
jgi:hypothetical protein